MYSKYTTCFKTHTDTSTFINIFFSKLKPLQMLTFTHSTTKSDLNVLKIPRT